MYSGSVLRFASYNRLIAKLKRNPKQDIAGNCDKEL